MRWAAKHPLLSISGWFLSALSIPLSLYLFVKATPTRELAILEPAVRSVFVNRNLPPALDVRVNAAKVTEQDVFAAQFAVWNNGNQSIRPENVLEAVELLAPETGRIIDAQFLRKSRDVCGLSVQIDAEGKAAKLEWKILEPDDGAIVQLLIVGRREDHVNTNGVIEGGGTPRYVRYSPATEKDSKSVWSPASGWGAWTLLFLVTGLFALAGIRTLIIDLPKAWRFRHLRRGKKKVSDAIVCGVLLIGAVVFLTYLTVIDFATGLHVLSSLLTSEKTPNNSK